MRRVHRILLVLVAVVAVVILALAYFMTGHSPGVQSSAELPSVDAALVSISQPVERTFSRRVSWVGVVQSQASVQVKALQAGRIQTIEAADQMPIQEGASIGQLGGHQVDAQRAQLQTAIRAAGSQLDLAGQTVERLQQNLGEQLATKDQLTVAQQAQIKLQAELRDAELMLQSFERQTRIVAPASGVFTNRQVGPGQTVSVGDVIAEIIDPNHLRIAASLFPPSGAQLKGTVATVRLNDSDLLAGAVLQVLPQAGSTGATIVWIEGPGIDRRLRPGQTVAGDVTVETRRASLAVPQTAIVYSPQEQPYLFVRMNDTYERRSVRLGLTQDGWVEVLSGLQPGESVVTRGAYEILNEQFNRQYRVED